MQNNFFKFINKILVLITMDIEVARTPPTKGTGIVERTAPIFVNIPSRIKIMPATSNVRRLATYKN